MLDELAHAGAEHLDDGCAAAYDRKAGADVQVDLDRLRRLGLDARSTLIDLGAGTGTLVVAAVPYSARVIAVDVSPAMLGVLRAKLVRLRLSNVACIQAGFLTYEHEGRPADFAYSRNALHQLPDFWKSLALLRLARTLRPGGVLILRDLVFSCGPSDIESVVRAWLGSAAENPAEGYTRADFETHLRAEHSTFSWLIEPMLERAGFKIESARHSDSQIYATYECVRTTAPV